MTGKPDISKIISLIMENPKLIEEISALANGDAAKVTPAEEADEAKEAEKEREEDVEQIKSIQSSAPVEDRVRGGRNRSQLLFALKPYVSRERAQAIDSMLSIVEILDVMKGR